MAARTRMDVDSRAFADGLKVALRKLELRSEADLLRLGLKVQNNARQRCPVDTGRLRASITIEQGRDRRGPFVKVGTNVDYAPYVEFGTRHNRAQPFMRPALLDALSLWGGK